MHIILWKQDAVAFMEQWGFPSSFPKMQHYKLDTLPMDHADAADQVNQAPLKEGMQNTTEEIAESKVDCTKTSGAFGGHREALENKPQLPVQAQKS
jgi:hypothetical protein